MGWALTLGWSAEPCCGLGPPPRPEALCPLGRWPPRPPCPSPRRAPTALEGLLLFFLMRASRLRKSPSGADVSISAASSSASHVRGTFRGQWLVQCGPRPAVGQRTQLDALKLRVDSRDCSDGDGESNSSQHNEDSKSLSLILVPSPLFDARDHRS